MSYKCDCCGRILLDSEVNFTYDDRLDETYINCKHCGNECREYDDEEWDDQNESL